MQECSILILCTDAANRNDHATNIFDTADPATFPRVLVSSF